MRVSTSPIVKSLRNFNPNCKRLNMFWTPAAGARVKLQNFKQNPGRVFECNPVPRLDYKLCTQVSFALKYTLINF